MLSHLWKKAGVIIVCVSLLGGCVQTAVLEKIGLVVAIGYDRLPENKLHVTSVVLNAEPGSNKKTRIISSISNSVRGAKNNNNKKLSHTLLNGQVRVALFGERLAKQGLNNIVETLARAPFIGDMVFLAISKDPVHKLFSHDYKGITNIGKDLYEMLEQHIRDDWVPSCTIHDFRKACYSDGTDASLPLLRMQDEGVEIFGLALFRDDRFVGTLDSEEGYLVKLLQGKRKTNLKEIKIDRKELCPYLIHDSYLHQTRYKDAHVRIVISNLGSKSKIRCISAKNLKFQVDVCMDVQIQEVTDPYDFSKPQANSVLNREIKKTLTKEIKQLIAELQRLNTDVIGFGETYRACVRNSKLTISQWHRMFPNIKIQPHVQVNIVRTGTIE